MPDTAYRREKLVDDGLTYDSSYGIFSDLVHRGERLCREVAARELHGRPVYITLTAEIEGVPPNSWAGGWFDEMHGVGLRDAIGRRWRGPGVSLVIDARWIRFKAVDRANVAALRGYGPQSIATLVRQCFYETTIHELAHGVVDLWADRKQPLPVPSVAAAAVRRRRVIDQLSRPFEEMMVGFEPWAQHGLTFIRAAACLARRAEWIVRLNIEPIYGGARYCLSNAHSYEQALADELDGATSCNLLDLLDYDPPRDAVDLWLDDMRHYETTQHSALLAADIPPFERKES